MKSEKEKYDFYQKLRDKIDNWLKSKKGNKQIYSKYIMWAPDLFHLLLKLSIDKDVSKRNKVKLGIAITYFISPLDLIPEGIVGPVGYIDDIALAAYTLDSIINESDPSIVKKHWAGDDDVLEVIQQIIDFTNRKIGSGIMKKLRSLL